MAEDEKSTINVTSHNQSGGITAHTVHMGRAPREVTPQMLAEIQAALAGRSVNLISVMGDNESWTLAENLAHELSRIGVPAEHGEYRQIFGRQPPPFSFLPGNDRRDISLWVGANV